MKTCSAYQRERCVAAEMEACWEPTSSKASLPGYEPESDPFCPLAIARNFNQMQREASINGTQSLIDLRQPSAAFSQKNTTRASSQRPQSSGGRIATTPPPQALRGQVALPYLAGAALRHKDGGGLMATRQPPLRPSKGLPSSTQISKASARRRAKERKRTSTSNIREGAFMGSEPDRPATVELSSGEREEFAAKVARRDDILQDVWLKMHSVEVFATTQGGGELAQLLNLYRSASLEIIEDVMQHPDLEKVGDKHTAKKGEGMRSFRTAFAQDADFADGIPEAIAWLGFPTRRNPLFLPPKGAVKTDNKPLSDIGLDSANSGDQLARLWDAQDFILLEKQPAPLGGNGGFVEFAGGSGGNVATKSGNNALGGGSSGSRRRPNIRDRIRGMSNQLAGAQGTIRDLEEKLRSLEAEREEDRERATRVRGAAREAGQRKMTQRMYRLRGDAAVLEEGIEDLDGEITAVRVRLFAERLDVARKRMLKDALTAEVSAQAKARRRKAKEQNQPNSSAATGTEGTERRRGKQDTSAVTIQARVRGMRARASLESEREARASRRRGSAGEEETDRRLACCGDNDKGEEAAAVRIESAARGHLARKRAAEAAATQGESRPAPPAACCSLNEPTKKEGEGRSEVLGNGATAAAVGPAPAPPLPPDSLAQLEALGAVGVRAFFDYLGLGGCADRLRGGDAGSSGAIDGARLAGIARASDPDAELLAAGVCARLHRVKLLSILGIGHGATTASEEVVGVLDEGELASASASSGNAVGGVPCGERCGGSGGSGGGGGGSGGGGGASPVAAMAALQMVRQLRRELLPSAESTGPTDYNGNGATDPRGTGGGKTEMLENRAAARGERESLVSELIPELEEVLSAQLRLSTQMQKSRHYHAEAGGRR
ncbi:unnamed protein product [Ectocarpus fasciculatus]